MDVRMLDQRAHKMLDTLKGLSAGWHSRADIASVLDKKRLTDADVMILDYLEKEGHIEAEQHDTGNATIPRRWEYRVK